MGHVEDRWWRALPDGSRVPRDRQGVGLRWRGRYRDADGQHRARSFARKKDADRFLTPWYSADLLRGSYVDPGLSKRSLRSYAAVWLAAQPVRSSTRRAYDSHLRNWILPALGHRSLRSLTPTDVRGLVRRLTERLAPRTAWHIHGLLATILRSAVQDGWLAQSPCRRTAPVKPRLARVIPLTVAQVQALLDALPPAYRVAGLLGAGCGLRVGEVLGLAVSDIDLDEQVLRIEIPAAGRARRSNPCHGRAKAQPRYGQSRYRTRSRPRSGCTCSYGLRAAWENNTMWIRQRTFWCSAPGRPGMAADLPRQDLAASHPDRRPARSAVPWPAALLRQRPHRRGESSAAIKQPRLHSAVETLDIYAGLWPDHDPALRTAIDKLLT